MDENYLNYKPKDTFSMQLLPSINIYNSRKKLFDEYIKYQITTATSSSIHLILETGATHDP